MEMTKYAFLPSSFFFFLTFEKMHNMINQDSVVMKVKGIEDEPTKTSYVEGSDGSWKSLFLYEMQKMSLDVPVFF